EARMQHEAGGVSRNLVALLADGLKELVQDEAAALERERPRRDMLARAGQSARRNQKEEPAMAHGARVTQSGSTALVATRPRLRASCSRMGRSRIVGVVQSARLMRY